MAEQIAHVTEELSRELARTSSALAAIDRKSKTPNDKDAYAGAASQLETLTVAVLSATSSLSLIHTRPAGARFDIASGTDLARQVTMSVTYLREEASSLLRAGTFSAYESTHTGQVLNQLRAMYHLVVSGVDRQARKDLATLQSRDVKSFLQAVENLAKYAESGSGEGLVAKIEARQGRAPLIGM